LAGGIFEAEIFSLVIKFARGAQIYEKLFTRRTRRLRGEFLLL
jgi:hypothetical protein